MKNAFLEASGRRKKLTLASVYCGLFGAILISSTQSTMLPAAAMEIGGGNIYSLVATLSGVVSVIAMPLFGYFSAKNPALKSKLFSIPMLLSAVVIFTRSIAVNMWQIIIPGMLYGLVSAAIYVVGFSAIRDIFGGKKAAYYLGFVATMQSVGQIVGPTVGGAVMDSGSWRRTGSRVIP